MRRFFLLAIVALAGLILSAQTESKNFNVSSFTGIDAGGVFNIELTRSNNPSVIIDTDAEVMEYIKVDVSRDVLRLKLDTDKMPRSMRRDIAKIYVKIGMQEFKYLDLSGASKLTCLSSFSTDSFKAEISGASNVNDLRIDCRTFSIDVSGATKMTIGGKVSEIAKYDLSGASNLDIRQDAGNLEIDGSGASKIKYTGNVDNKVNVDISGASSVVMTGKGAKTMNIGLSGASKFNSLDFPVADVKVGLSGVSKADVHALQTLSTNVSGGSKLNYKGDAKVVHSTLPSINKID